MSAKKSKSNEPAITTSYRITKTDRKLIESKHGKLTNFLNKKVAEEVAIIKKSAKGS